MTELELKQKYVREEITFQSFFIAEYLLKLHKSASLLEIKKALEKENIDIDYKKEIKSLMKEGLIHAQPHYEHNSNKKFKHKDGKIETIKGTKIYKYKFIE